MFLIGICIGSFIYNLYLRERKSISWWKGYSKCEYCHTSLPLLHKVPLLSFLFLKGKCYFCKHKLSNMYFYFELFFGMLFHWIHKISILSLLLLLIIMSIIDWYRLTILDTSLCLLFLLLCLFIPLNINLLSISFIIFLIPFSLVWNKIGFGDLKVLFIFSLFMDSTTFFLSLKIACYCALIYGIYSMILSQKHNKTQIPFMPFLAIGYLCNLISLI